MTGKASAVDWSEPRCDVGGMNQDAGAAQESTPRGAVSQPWSNDDLASSNEKREATGQEDVQASTICLSSVTCWC